MTQEEAERRIIDVIEAQFDIHAMDPEDFAEMWVGISAVLREFVRPAPVEGDRAKPVTIRDRIRGICRR